MPNKDSMVNGIGNHPKAIIVITLIITLFFAAQIPKAELDNDNYRFVPADDPSLLTSERINDTFSNTNYILIGLEQKNGTIFDADFLNLLVEFTMRVEDFGVAERIQSLVTSDYIYGEDDGIDQNIIVDRLVPDDYLNDGGDDEAFAAALKEKVLSWDFYNKTLVSEDLASTQVLIALASDEEDRSAETDSYLRIRDLAAEMFGDTANVYVTGLPVISASINESVKADLLLLLPLVIAVVLIIMYLPIRSVKAVMYALLPVFVSIICTMGAMPLFNVKLSVISTVIPVVLVAVGNSYGLHIVIHYLDDLKRGGKDLSDFGARKAFTLGVLKTVWMPIFLAMITTLVSFLSFCWTRVMPIFEFGVFAAFGVLVAYLTSITFLPAVLILARPKITFMRSTGTAHLAKADAFARIFSAFITQRKTVIFAVSGVLVVVSVFGSFRLIVDNIFIEYFRRQTTIVRADEFIRREFGGSKVISVMVEADTPEVILHPDTLAALDGLNEHLMKNVRHTGKVMSYTSLIKRMNQVVYAGNNDFAYYEIPVLPERYGKNDKDELRGLIANYLFFLASSDTATAYANDPFEPTAIRSIVQLSTVGERDTNAVVSAINAYIGEHFPSNITVTIGGPALAEISTNHLVVQSVWTSMIIAFVGLFLILAFVNKSIAVGLLGVLPLLVVVIINFAVMGFFGIKLNIGTAMIFSLTMGIGIDYTIHFLEAIKRSLKENPKTFLETSYRTSGIAIITDALSTGVGFAVLLLSRFVMLAHFGALVSLSLINSALVGLVLMPALLIVIKPKFYKDKQKIMNN
jgi:predicted RND superfamily exporter protein